MLLELVFKFLTTMLLLLTICTLGLDAIDDAVMLTLTFDCTVNCDGTFTTIYPLEDTASPNVNTIV